MHTFSINGVSIRIVILVNVHCQPPLATAGCSRSLKPINSCELFFFIKFVKLTLYILKYHNMIGMNYGRI